MALPHIDYRTECQVGMLLAGGNVEGSFVSVHSTFFGVTKLTGNDAEAFSRQVTYGRPNQAAIESLRKGDALLRQLGKKGYAVAGASHKVVKKKAAGKK